ncbi:MAG: hypothetical protein M0P91_04655 [Sulfuricurvum sp.]|jgi:hypothetical protein|uniref:hypothetical protein n=1 Tax=Sulfuricurvum sp. TaxID=2025608 RepID=UPI0025EA7941|nr:hypothetical protein [Sulfuricurvum sp.]MCK9372466.1 hypothetical protein [Sulfuricurvum sp.]
MKRDIEKYIECWRGIKYNKKERNFNDARSFLDDMREISEKYKDDRDLFIAEVQKEQIRTMNKIKVFQKEKKFLLNNGLNSTDLNYLYFEFGKEFVLFSEEILPIEDGYFMAIDSGVDISKLEKISVKLNNHEIFKNQLEYYNEQKN